MFKELLLYAKYPSVAGIIVTIWVASGIIMVHDATLPVYHMILTNIGVSILIGIIGFRVDKR